MNNQANIKLSVIICTYNRASFLINALNSLAEQDCDKSLFEIIIVSNNSTDNTEEVSQQFISKHPEIQTKFVIEYNQGLSFGRNRGIAESNAEIITYIDDDAIATPNFVKNIIQTFKNFPDYSAVGGKVIPVYYPQNTEPAWMSKYIQGVVSKVDYGEQITAFKKKYPAGCNMSFRKKVFDEIGKFNTDLTVRSDDKFIFYQIKKHNKKILYAPNIVVYHHIDNTRISREGIKRLSLQIGQSEQYRLKGASFLYKFIKLSEFIFKLIASWMLALLFILKGKFPKADYIIYIRWFILIGFFKKEFVK